MALTNSLLYELSCNSIEKNIELAHLALQSSACIPHKREIIVLWVYRSLVNHSQYSSEEVSNLWKLLFNMLQEIHPEEVAVLMQESFLEVVIKGLQGLAPCDDLSGKCYLVKATQCLLEKAPPGILFLKLCDMENMLLTVLKCCCKVAEAGCQWSSELTSILSLLLGIVSSAWDKHPYSVKATVLHLKPLLGFMTWVLKICEGSTVPELIHVQSQIKKLVTTALFHRDKLKGWMSCLEAYLTCEEASLAEAPAQPEHLEAITTVIDDAYESMVSRGYSSADYLPLVLPVILEGFMASNRSVNIQCNVVLLAYLTSVLGVNSDVPFKKVIVLHFSLTEEKKLHFLGKLLEVYRKSDQYHTVMVLPQRKKAAFKLKKWFGELGGCLENMDYRNTAWFACINTAMSIAPNLVEGIMVKTLQKCWVVHSLENPDIDKAQDEFLENMVQTYEKLFRIPKLLRNIFSSLSLLKNERADILHITPGFLRRFSTSCTVMSSGQMTESWSLFIKQLTYWITKSKESGKYMLREVSGSVEIFCTFLLHIQVATPTMPASDVSRVAELMADTTKLASQMLDYSLEQQLSDCAYCALMICHAWGEVHTVLLSYRRTYEETNGRPSIGPMPLEEKDLSHMHSVLTVEEVNCLLSLPDESKKVLYVMLLLETQKMRSFLLCCEASSVAAIESMELTAAFIFSCADLTSPCKEWDQKVQSITKETFPTAALQLLLTFSPILVPCLKAKNLVKLCECMLHILQECQDVVHTQTPGNIVKEYLASQSFRESKPMQTAFVTAVWSHASNIIRGKKRKHDTEVQMQSYQTLFQTLSNSAGAWHKNADTIPKMDYTSKRLVGPSDLNKMWATIYHASQCLLGLMDCFESVDKVDHKDIMLIIDALEFLPLEDLFPGNHTRCILGLLGILFLLSKGGTSRHCELDQENDTAVKAVCRMLTTLLDGTRRPWLLDFVDGGLLFEKVVAVFSDIFLKALDDGSLYNTFEDFLNRILRDAFRKRSTIRTLMPLVKQFEKVTPCSALLKSKPFSSAAILLFNQLTMELSKNFLHADTKPYLQKSASKLSDVLNAWLLCFLEDNNVHATARKEAFWISALQIKYCVAVSRLPTDEGSDEPCSDTVSAVIALAASDVMKSKGRAEEYNKALSLLSVAIKYRQMLPKIPELPVCDIWASALFLLTDEAKMSGDPPLTIENCLKEEEFEFLETVFKCCTSEELKNILDHFFSLMLSHGAESTSMKIHLKTFEVLCCGLAHSGQNCSKEIPRVLQKFVEHLCATLAFLDVAEDSDLITGIIRILGMLLGMKKPSMTHQSGAVILQVLSSLNFTEPFTDMKYFCECYQIVCRILSTFLLHRTYLVSGRASVVHSCIAMLIRGLVKVSGIDEVRRYPGPIVEQLLLCAVSLERLTAILESYTREFGKITPFLIAEYIAESVDITLHPPVKKTLVFVMNKLFSVSSVPSNEMVLVTLPKEGTEVFKALYADSKKLSFKGKV